ncbi:MAG: hypothetical protein JW984_14225 [Deltaproteobacteria bacterium]|uniref:Uncharacterized protein n=1 Tax=Candidatus Zymogenus saltonus TaxID=2844893 RepID=A0A9D8PRP9_9DELT|nr:hypothetical protein [Candidatus Zymogenus saltonus]
MPIEPIGWMLDSLQMLQAEKFAFESEKGINEVLSILDYVKESCDKLLDKLSIKKPDYEKREYVSAITEELEMLKTGAQYIDKLMIDLLEKRREKREERRDKIKSYIKEIDFSNEDIETKTIQILEKVTDSVIDFVDNVDKGEITFWEDDTTKTENQFNAIIGFAEKIRNLTPNLQNWFDKESEKLDSEREGREENKSTKENVEGLTKAADDLELAHASLMETIESLRRVNETIKTVSQENKFFNIDESLNRLQKRIDEMTGGEGASSETEEKMSSKTSDSPEKAGQGVSHDDLGIEIRDSKRSIISEIDSVKSALEALIKEIEKKAMTFDQIYKKLCVTIVREHRNATGRIIGK